MLDNGLFKDPKVTIQRSESIEHGTLNDISSIVLHRTAGSSAKASLNAYASGQKTGAHFLIDKEGKIYQTASLKKRCWHVGKLYSRCLNEKSCSPEELKTVTALLHEKGVSFSKRTTNLSRHEVKKSYPLRFPSNDDSLGIEVVGRYNKSASTLKNQAQNSFLQQSG